LIDIFFVCLFHLFVMKAHSILTQYKEHIEMKLMKREKGKS
jgi:hypothetical protein